MNFFLDTKILSIVYARFKSNGTPCSLSSNPPWWAVMEALAAEEKQSGLPDAHRRDASLSARDLA